MSKRSGHLDDLLASWPYHFGDVAARKVAGKDGREVLQLRIDLGILQMEAVGRPDGQTPGGHDTVYDQLLAQSFEEGEDFELTDERRSEIDREFVQFYHRRIGWLALREFGRAIDDANHTLKLMDFSSAHADDDDWVDMHEQYRPFVLFHRTQAEALGKVDAYDPEGAISALDEGLEEMHAAFARQGCEDEYEEDDLVLKIRAMRTTLLAQYSLEPPLTQQLAEAVAREQYELAAELRDRIARRTSQKAR